MPGNNLPLQAQATVQKSSRFLLPASVLIVMLIVAAAGTYIWYYHYLPRSCEVNAVHEASALLVSQRKRYDHVYQFATSASRTSLVYPITVLQQILMDTQEIVVPVCMQTAKNELISYMRGVNRAFQAFGAGEAYTTIRGLLDESYTHFDKFTAELKAVNKCAPFCISY